MSCEWPRGAGDLELSSDVHQALLTIFAHDLDDDMGDILTRTAGVIMLGGLGTGQQ